MRRTFTRVFSGLSVAALVSGCGDSGYSPNVSGTPSAADSAAEPADSADSDTTATDQSATDAADPNESAQASTGADSQAAPVQSTADTDGGDAAPEETTLGEVGVGVGRKGQAYGGNIYTAPLAANFRARERIVFDIEIKRHMNFFQATHERLPESHEEFMTEIIRANRIQLPDLPEGEEYFYDATDGELKRKIPKPPGQ